jgi:transmembrane sensor
MGDLAERVAKAKDHAAPDWSPERANVVRARIDVKAAMRRKVKRNGAVAFALAAVVLTAFVVWHRPPAPQTVLREAAPALLRLEDGSTAVGKSQDARVEPIEIGPTVASMRLLSGVALFSVTPNKNRVFTVLARDVTVTVLGTVFSVGLEPGGVRVTVERGRVHVAWPAGERVLNLGEEAFIADTPAEGPAAVAPQRGEEQAEGDRAPAGSTDVSGTQAGEGAGQPAAAEPVQQGAVEPVQQGAAEPVQQGTNAEPTSPSPAVPTRATAPSAASPGAVSSTTSASWRALAQDGDYSGAYKMMQSNWSGVVRDEPGDLLLAADVARLGGHPDRAIGPLQRVVEKHAGDSRAPLAAFTLGRTLLDQLGRPREAASAFATARRLEPRGAMAQDALAREVESWSRAGEASLARERAEQYVSLYPKGRRLGAVRRLGGLD